MKKHIVLYPFLALLALSVATLACSFSASTANIRSATLARGYENEEAVDATTVFAPSDQVIHLVVKVANAPDDTTVKAAWHAVEVAGFDAQLIDETSVTLSSGEDTVDFTLANDQNWPAGKYKVELYLNDELDQTLEYEVAE